MKRTLPVVFLLGVVPMLGRGQAPVLLSTVPGANSLSGPRTGPLSLLFSQPVANPTAIRVSSNMRKGLRPGTFSGVGTRQVAFQPSQPFAPGERVSLTVPAAVSSPGRVVEFRAAAGRGAATFSPPVTIAPGPMASPESVAAADVDNDGDMDLLVAEYQSTGVTICLNDGTGQFTPRPNRVVTVNQPEKIKLADFNGDGALDLLSYVTNNSPEVVLNLGDGQGGFQGRTSLLRPNFHHSVATGDFNADGLADVVVASPSVSGTGLGTLHFLPGTSSGVMPQASTSPLTLGYDGLDAADMDGDGDLDLLLVTSNELSISLNDGTGQFTAGASVSINSGARTVTTGDFTGDGFPDVVCSNQLSANLSLVPGDGSGGLLPRRNVAALSRTGILNSADMDGDLDLDLLVTNDRGITQVLLNNGAGQFSPASAVLIGLEPFFTADAADLNGDGSLDVYTGHNQWGPNFHGIDIFFNQAPTVSSTKRSAPLDVSLSPNPAHGQTQLQLPPSTGVMSIEILDLLGRVVQTVPTVASPGRESIMLPLVGLRPGLYLVQVRTRTGRSQTRLEVE